MARASRAALLVLLTLPLAALPGPAGAETGEAALPDLRTVVPHHVQLVFPQGREVLRFSNGIANTGAGPLDLRPEFPVDDPASPQRAFQDVLDAEGQVVESRLVSTFEYHPAHRHWHVAAVARFEVRHALDDGTGGSWGAPVANDRGEAVSVKTTFCLIDWYALDGPSRTPDRRYFDCNGARQGLSPGWVDQYNHAVDGQDLDVTDAPAGIYYLVSAANPDGVFAEADGSNNVAWTSFSLPPRAHGRPAISPVARSPCEGAMCGDGAPNR